LAGEPADAAKLLARLVAVRVLELRVQRRDRHIGGFDPLADRARVREHIRRLQMWPIFADDEVCLGEVHIPDVPQGLVQRFPGEAKRATGNVHESPFAKR
jgi:hypothetical protein